MPQATSISVDDRFLGKWWIVSTELWEKEFVDLVAPGFIEFSGRDGEMRFIAVRAWLDVRYGERDRLPCAEFSWEGKDERDDRSGRGWAILSEKDKLSGQFYFHMGDESKFEAVRA